MLFQSKTNKFLTVCKTLKVNTFTGINLLGKVFISHNISVTITHNSHPPLLLKLYHCISCYLTKKVPRSANICSGWPCISYQCDRYSLCSFYYNECSDM